MEWESYHKKTEERSPRPNLVEALKYVEERNIALELGAGAMNDARYLLKEGFGTVVAVDKTEEVRERGDQLNNPKLEIVISSFENFEFPKEKFDLVNAQFSLPFVNKEYFDRVFSEAEISLKKGGIFSGQLFGVKDGWRSTNPTMTFHTLEEARKLFKDMELIKFEEIEKDAETASGHTKHWHIFNFISRK